MTKLKELILFIKSGVDIRTRIVVTLEIIRAIYEIPAFIFHECMHLLFIFLANDIKIKNLCFLKIEGNTLTTYNMQISYSANSYLGSIISIMPLIGWIIAVIILSITGQFLILIYFIMAFRAFYLSDIDIKVLKMNGLNYKICKNLKLINKIIK